MRRASLADAPLINELLNDPLIRPTIGGNGELDITTLLSDGRNVCLFDERGGAFFRWSGPGIYEGHSFFRVRGREAIRLGKQILSQLTCEKVWGATPLELKHVRLFNRLIGFASLGEIDTPEGRCELFEMRK